MPQHDAGWAGNEHPSTIALPWTSMTAGAPGIRLLSWLPSLTRARSARADLTFRISLGDRVGVDQTSLDLQLVASERGCGADDPPSFGERAEYLVPGLRRTMVRLVDEDEVENRSSGGGGIPSIAGLTL
jgi:hypothetical protein